MLTCKRMRTGILTSALLLTAGFLLEIFAQTTQVGMLASYVALFLVLAAAAVLATTFAASLLPGTAERLKECQH